LGGQLDNHRASVGFFILLYGILSAAGSVCAQQVTYSGTLQYTTGSYFFEENTESISLVNGFGFSAGSLSVSISVPFIIQNSPWVSYGGPGQIPTGGPEHKAVREASGSRRDGGHGIGGTPSPMLELNQEMQKQGKKLVVLADTSSYTKASFGDPGLFTSLILYTSYTGSAFIRLNTGLKFPLANPGSGFGTGKWDYGAGLSASQRIERWIIFTYLMKWWLGNFEELSLNNPLTYSFGLGHSFGDGRWLINSTYSGYTKIIDGYEPPKNLNFGVGFLASDRTSLSSTLTFGLSESSSDLSFGLGWSISF